MTQEEKIRVFGELEQLFQRYYRQHLEKTVKSDATAWHRREEKLAGSRSSGWDGYTDAASPWSGDKERQSPSYDDLVDQLVERFVSDPKVSEDLAVIAARWRDRAVEAMGEEKYKELSAQCSCGDLAIEYLVDRLTDKICGTLLNKGSADYVLRKSLSESLLGLFGVGNVHGDAGERALREYRPSGKERFASVAGMLSLDALFGPVGVIDLVIGAHDFLSGDKDSDFQQEVSKSLFGSSDGLRRCREYASRHSTKDSRESQFVNPYLHHKVRMKFNDQSVHESRQSFLKGCKDSGKLCLLLMEHNLSYHGIVYKYGSAVPEWMKGKSEKDLVKYASYYYGILMEMRDKGLKTIKVGRNTLSYEQVAQRAYDYAQAADEKHRENHPEDYVPEDHWYDDNAYLIAVRREFARLGIAFNTLSDVPDDLLALSDDALQRRYELRLMEACEMKAAGERERVIDGKTMSLETVAQEAYDAARVIDYRDRLQRQQKQDQEQEQSSRREQEEAGQKPAADEREKESRRSDRRPSRSSRGRSSGASSVPDPSRVTGSWQDFFDSIGLGGLSFFGNGFGKTLANLPELLTALFTGKVKNFSFKENLIPLAMLMAGLFMSRRSHPIMKILLLAFGALMLAKNAERGLTGETVGGSRAPSYRRYQDEPLNPRMRDVQVRGDSIICTIDGVPTVLHIREDAVLDAYYKGAIPLNTLCNAALRSYDSGGALPSVAYERQTAYDRDEQRRDVSRGLR